MEKQKTRKQAALELLPLYNSMEVKKVKLSTLYKKITKLENGCWHCEGAGYNYTI